MGTFIEFLRGLASIFEVLKPLIEPFKSLFSWCKGLKNSKLNPEIEAQLAELERLKSEKNLIEIKKKAEDGNAAAQYRLANNYYKEKNYKEAVKWYRRAAEREYVFAMHNLGNAYYKGLGVKQDYTEAFRWYRKAAEKGYSTAQYFLGNAYYSGKTSLPKDYAESVKWYRLAAEQGHAKAQCNLGNAYQNGLGGLEKNYVEAAKWYRLTAEQGEKTAQEKLQQLEERIDKIRKAIKS